MGAQSYPSGGRGAAWHHCAEYLAVYLDPENLLPEQDTGVLMGGIQADQSISFQAMRGKLQDFMKIIRDDPAVDNVTGFTGGSRVNSGMMFITLKPRGERSETAQQIIDACVKNWRKNRERICS